MKPNFYFYLLVGLFLSLTHCVYCQMPTNNIWPVGGDDSKIDQHSSPFGPRLKASESFRYDFHRGIDLPCDLNTPLLAIADGEVRIDGEHPAYSDGVVQLKHDFGEAGIYYTNYLHIESTDLNKGDIVQRGDVVALSGQTNNFPHVHFELRKNDLFQRNCVNPWIALPFETIPNHISVSFGSIAALASATNDYRYRIAIDVSVLRAQLDFNEIVLRVTASDDTELYLNGINFEEINLATEEAIDLDNNIQNGIEINPARFSTDSDSADYQFIFLEINLNTPLEQIAKTKGDNHSETLTFVASAITVFDETVSMSSQRTVILNPTSTENSSGTKITMTIFELFWIFGLFLIFGSVFDF
mmetsp:Transcript_22186/g.33016  ORF Transcript_22186/g.33016 Transcript_22186/m.33016 type:complete len:357 (-) Transcript_22186:106-1176(-)